MTIPILTLADPGLAYVPLGVVAVKSEWNLSYANAVADVQTKLNHRIPDVFPTAVIACNLKLRDGDGYHGHSWYEATVDVYARRP